MGGEITYTCLGGNTFVFDLIFYRDCNGAEINMISENIKVWNHPSISSINLPFISRVDISPLCTQVVGGPSPFDCGSGSAGGNGIGAIEKITYRSLPITMNGIPLLRVGYLPMRIFLEAGPLQTWFPHHPTE